MTAITHRLNSKVTFEVCLSSTLLKAKKKKKKMKNSDYLINLD